MNRRLAGPDHSPERPVRRGDGDSEWQDWLVDDSETRRAARPTARSSACAASCWRGAEDADRRERDILIERRLRDEPTTLEELSQQYGVSRERVRQIEVRAFEKLQTADHQDQRAGTQAAAEHLNAGAGGRRSAERQLRNCSSSTRSSRLCSGSNSMVMRDFAIFAHLTETTSRISVKSAAALTGRFSVSSTSKRTLR